MNFLYILSIALAAAAAADFPQIEDQTEERFWRIAHGEDYDHEKYQYVVIVMIATKYDEFELPVEYTLCTGSLISQLIVLTAAHCTDGAKASECMVNNR